MTALTKIIRANKARKITREIYNISSYDRSVSIQTVFNLEIAVFRSIELAMLRQLGDGLLDGWEPIRLVINSQV